MKKTAVFTVLTAVTLSFGSLLGSAALAQTSSAETGGVQTEAQAEAQTAVGPFDLNTATDEELLTIPGVGSRMLREFKEYRPYANIAQFERELGKYVDAAQVATWEQYAFVATNPNTATAEQLTALPGIDQAVADAIVANRDYADWSALQAALLKQYDSSVVNGLAPYWVF